MIKFKLVFIFVTVALLSCILCAQSTSHNFIHDGIQRNYLLYLPSNYQSNNEYPLVVNLHGYTSNAAQQELLSGFNSIADTANFIIVYPNGTLDNTNTTFWNAGYGASVDDIGFINTLIDTLAVNYSVDLDRVYATGLSNGSYMSNTLACELNDRFAAIASVAGGITNLQKNNCTTNNKIPVMHIHGTGDLVVSYNGIPGFAPKIDDFVAFWVAHNGLNSGPTVEVIPDINSTDFSTAEIQTYSSGNTDLEVKLYKVNNGGHSWPGSTFPFGVVTNQDFNASAEIWKFFRKYKKGVLSTNISRGVVNNPNHIYYDNSTYSLQMSLNETVNLSLYTISGKKVMQNKYDKGFHTLQLEKKGLYIVSYTSSSGSWSKKILRLN